jgi:hypothetical protein
MAKQSSSEPRSRTGKFVQGLFGRGKKPPSGSPTAPDYLTRKVESIEPDQFPSFADADFDDDEDTNWEDEETPDVILERLSAQLPAEDEPTGTIGGDTEDWDDALPSHTVKPETPNSTSNPASQRPDSSFKVAEDFWENTPAPTQKIASPAPSTSPSLFDRAVGLWTALARQLYRLLPPPVQKFTGIILSGILVAIVTFSIGTIDRLLASAPTTPSPAPIVASKPTETIPSTPSPEQLFAKSLIAELDRSIGEYPDDIVESISVDLPRDRLIVKVNPQWYAMAEDRQEDLAHRIWQQTRANQLTRLELEDLEGRTVARSPVIGDRAIVIRHHQNNA